MKKWFLFRMCDERKKINKFAMCDLNIVAECCDLRSRGSFILFFFPNIEREINNFSPPKIKHIGFINFPSFFENEKREIRIDEIRKNKKTKKTKKKSYFFSFDRKKKKKKKKWLLNVKYLLLRKLRFETLTFVSLVTFATMGVSSTRVRR
jgi:hypothetical protein